MDLSDGADPLQSVDDCIIWDLTGSKISEQGRLPLEHALLVCGRNEQNRLEVRYFDANRKYLLRELEDEKSCVKLRAALEKRIQRRARRTGAKSDFLGPVAGKFLSQTGEDSLLFQAVVRPWSGHHSR